MIPTENMDLRLLQATCIFARALGIFRWHPVLFIEYSTDAKKSLYFVVRVYFSSSCSHNDWHNTDPCSTVLSLVWGPNWAGIFMQSRNRVGIRLSYPPAKKARICKILRSSRIDSKESISPAYVAWAGIFQEFMGARNRGIWNQFLGSINV